MDVIEFLAWMVCSQTVGHGHYEVFRSVLKHSRPSMSFGFVLCLFSNTGMDALFSNTVDHGCH